MRELEKGIGNWLLMVVLVLIAFFLIAKDTIFGLF